jgi:hypothetical protein
MLKTQKFRSHAQRNFEQPNAVLQTLLAMDSAEAGSNSF